ncbi:MAG TPA: phage portal protein, partial [Thermoleophilia bacterium]|nr:phage portal protein [Thermoleophilia bacterium]
VQYPVTLDIDIYGRAFTLGPLPAPQFWGDPELLRLIEEMEESGDGEPIERFKRKNFPLVWRHMSAPSVYPVFGDDGDLSEIVVCRKMKAREIRDRWGAEYAEDSKSTADIEVIEYANKAYVATVIPGKKDARTPLSWEHLMGRVPYAFFEGKRAPENDYGIQWRGALFSLEETIQAIDETVTDIRTSIRDDIERPIVVRVNPEIRGTMDGWPQTIDLKKNVTTNILPGEDFPEVPGRQIRVDAYQLIDRLKMIADQVGVRRDPLIGGGPPGESAVRLNVANQAAKAELKQEKSGLERGATQCVELIFESVAALSRQFPDAPDKVYVRMADNEHGSKEIAVTPANVESWEPLVDVTIPQNLPVDQVGLAQNASILKQNKLLSTRTLMQRDLGISNPVEEQDRIDEEEDREAIKPLLRTHLLNLLGQDLGQGGMTLDEILQQAQALGPGFAQVFQELLGGNGQPLDRAITSAGTAAGRAGQGQPMSDLSGMGTQVPQ